MATVTRATLLVGGPGTGKTRRLLRVMEGALKRGIAPERIGFVSFTNDAIDVAASRAMEQFNFARDRLPNFRTIHSLCFRQLGLRRESVVGPPQLQQLSELTGEKLTGRDEVTAPALGSEGDALLFIEQVSRVTGRTLRATWADHGGDLDWWRLDRFVKAYKFFKEDAALVDFADMLERYANGEGHPVSLDLAIIDEAQDLTPMQWRVVRRAFEGVPELWVAGDDDQTVHRWAGADVEEFLALPYAREELPVSHRVPRQVYDLAQSVTRRIGRRLDKTWQPTDKPGDLRWATSLDEAELGSGSWLLLARARSQLAVLADQVRQRGYVYQVKNVSSVKAEHLLAIRAYERFRRGGEAWTVSEARAVLRATGRESSKLVDGRTYTAAELLVDVSKIWHDAFVGFGVNEREYYLSCLRHGEKLTEPPRIRIDTLHGAKGRETDHVFLVSDLTTRTRRGLTLDPDSEHRVFYVGVTRARHSLTVQVPRRPGGYRM